MTEKTDTEKEKRKKRLTEILDKKEGSKNQTMIQLKDMEFLLELGGGEIQFNKELGNCYCHIMKYKEREFFDITGSKIYHNEKENTLLAKTHYSK